MAITGSTLLYSDGQESAPKCQICRRKQAKYTCPSCNLRYCSIDCFRNQDHAGCSEKFYKDSILRDVGNRADVSTSDKEKMLDMLKNLQDLDDPGDDLEEGDGSAATTSLEMLADLDLDGVSPEIILQHLTPEQRREFERLLQEPEQAAALLDQQNPQQLWWRQSSMAEGLDTDDSSSHSSHLPLAMPSTKLLKSTARSVDLTYNLVAILMAYILLLTLHDNDRSDVQALHSTIAMLLPFLGEKSSLVLANLAEASNYVFGNTPAHQIVNRRRLHLSILNDLQLLLTVSKIQEAGNDVASGKTYLALSDVYNILSDRHGSPNKTFCRQALPKVLFYASNLRTFDLHSVELHVDKLKQHLEAEEADQVLLTEDAKDARNLGSQKPPTSLAQDRPKIEEIA